MSGVIIRLIVRQKNETSADRWNVCGQVVEVAHAHIGGSMTFADHVTIRDWNDSRQVLWTWESMIRFTREEWKR